LQGTNKNTAREQDGQGNSGSNQETVINGGSKYLEDLFNEQQKGHKVERIIQRYLGEEGDIILFYR
jgi:hypothetical protein